MNTKPLTILYFGVNPPDKSMRDAPYIDGLKEKGVVFLECHDASSGLLKLWRLFKKHWALRGRYDAVFVGHSSTTVIPLMRFMTLKPILFNALNPLYDGMVLERNVYRPYSPHAVGIWLLDFLSFHLSTAVLLETEKQREYVQRHFFVPERKLFRVFTTAHPRDYHPDPAVSKSDGFLCVFRGWLTPATGAEHIIEAARILKNDEVRFRFIVRGQSVPVIKSLIQKYALSNVEFLEGFYPVEELRRLILSGHIYLGQFGSHSRLDKTIQFKTVEACAFGLPYITADLPSNRELLHNGVDCLFVRRADPQALADAILRLKNDPVLQARLGNAAHELYKKELAPEVLADQILAIMKKYLP